MPRLIVCRGRAGAGKTRLAEELRDGRRLLGPSTVSADWK